MRFWCAVLIAAVTVNCLVTAINGKTATNTAIEPFNMLLPPLEDKPQDAVKTTKAPATTTTRKTTTKATTTTAKPLTNNKVNNVLPELSIEALLPPLFDAKIEKAENEHKQQQPTKPTTTRAPTTTTTTRRTTTTVAYKPVSATTVPRTHKPELSKTTKKPKDLHSGGNANKHTPKQSGANKHVAEAKSKSKQIPQHVISNIEHLTTQQVNVKVAQKKKTSPSGSGATYHLQGLDVYLGSTTPRPPKYGLPTITPFPHRLGR